MTLSSVTTTSSSSSPKGNGHPIEGWLMKRKTPVEHHPVEKKSITAREGIECRAKECIRKCLGDWNKRYFTLDPAIGVLCYSEKPKSKRVSMIPLSRIRACFGIDDPMRVNSAKTGWVYGIDVTFEDDRRHMELWAREKAEAEKWVEALRPTPKVISKGLIGKIEQMSSDLPPSRAPSTVVGPHRAKGVPAVDHTAVKRSKEEATCGDPTTLKTERFIRRPQSGEPSYGLASHVYYQKAPLSRLHPPVEVPLVRGIRRANVDDGYHSSRSGSSYRSQDRSSGSARVIRSSRSEVIRRPRDTWSERGPSYEMLEARRFRPATGEPLSAPSRPTYSQEIFLADPDGERSQRPGKGNLQIAYETVEDHTDFEPSAPVMELAELERSAPASSGAAGVGRVPDAVEALEMSITEDDTTPMRGTAWDDWDDWDD